MVLSCHFSVYQKLFNIKFTWVVRGRMGLFHVYCFKSIGIYKNKSSRKESLVILYWGLNCTHYIMFCLRNKKINFQLRILPASIQCRTTIGPLLDVY